MRGEIPTDPDASGPIAVHLQRKLYVKAKDEKRHKVSSRGTRKFPGEKVFGELGIQRLRSLRTSKRPCALA